MKTFTLTCLAVLGVASIASADLVQDSSLIMRLRADSGVTTSSGVVTGWADMTTNGNNATNPWNTNVTASTSGFGPLNRAYLGFDVLASLTAPNLFSGNNARTVFAVIQYEGAGTTYAIGNVCGQVPTPVNVPDSAFQIQERPGTGFPYLAVITDDIASGVTTAPTAATTMLGSMHDGTTTTLFWENGLDGMGSATKALTLVTSTNAFMIGNYWQNLDMGIKGKFAEIAVYNRALSSGELAQNEAYYVSQYVVPEPGTLILLATGLIGLLAYAWRKLFVF